MTRQTYYPPQAVGRERLSRVVAPYLVPWVGSAVLIPAAELTRAMWDTPSGAPWAALSMAAGTVAVTGVTRVAARPRGGLIRDIATATVACCGAWWTGATFAGPLSHPTIDLWLFLAVMVGSTHNAMRVVRRSGADTAAMDGFDQFASQVNAMRRARIRKPRTIGRRVVADLEMPAGMPIDDFLTHAGRSHLAAQLDVPTSFIRTSPSSESARRGTVEIIDDQHLVKPLPWPGPSSPGGSIAEPLVLGEAEDGRPLQIWLPGDEDTGRSATHVLVSGMSGAGKTRTTLILAAEILSRRDVKLRFADTVKRDQTYGPIKHGLDQVADTDRAAKALLRQLVQVEIPQRTQWLGERGYDQWMEGCGLDYLVIVLGEAASLDASADLIVQACERARSAGVSLVLDLQRPTHDRLPVSARSNIGVSLCHGVKERADVKLSLSAITIAAGAKPDSWRNTKPGYLYVEAPGVAEDRWAVPHRAYLSTAAQLRAAVPDHRQVEDQPSEFADADTYVEQSVPTRLSLVPPPADRRMGTEAARELLDERIAGMAASGWTEFSPADLSDVLTETGRVPSWLTGELKSRCEGDDAKLAEAGRGVYRILVEVAS